MSLKSLEVAGVLLAAGALAACSRGNRPAHVEVTGLAPSLAANYTDTPVTILGSRFLSLVPRNCSLPCRLKLKKKGGVRFEMWQGSSDRLRRGFSLSQVTVDSDRRIRAVVPAGVPAGAYRLVIREGLSLRFTNLKLLVRQQKPNAGPPSVVRLRPSQVQYGHPARLVITGANLHEPVAVWLVGPLPEYNRFFGSMLAAGQGPPWPFDVSFPHRLLKVREENPAHISATIPPNLAPGRYAVRIQTASHAGHPLDLDHVVTVLPPKPGLSARSGDFVIYFGVMGLVFVVGMLYAWRQGDVGLARGKPRRHLLWMLAGLAFYVALIGTLQFWLSDWY